MNRSIRNLFLFLFICSCANFTNHTKVIIGELPSDIPAPIELKKRITELYEAEMSQDWLSWYNLTTQKNDISYEDFRKQFGSNEIEYRIISCGTKRFIIKPVPENNKNIKAAVAVEMDVQVKRTSGKPEKIKDLTDYWVYIGESWYWTWRGFPAD